MCFPEIHETKRLRMPFPKTTSRWQAAYFRAQDRNVNGMREQSRLTCAIHESFVCVLQFTSLFHHCLWCIYSRSHIRGRARSHLLFPPIERNRLLCQYLRATNRFHSNLENYRLAFDPFFPAASSACAPRSTPLPFAQDQLLPAHLLFRLHTEYLMQHANRMHLRPLYLSTPLCRFPKVILVANGIQRSERDSLLCVPPFVRYSKLAFDNYTAVAAES